MAKKKSPFSKGRAKRAAKKSGSPFIGLKDGESIAIAPLVGLDGMISADMHEYWDIRPAIFHPCIGRGCPGCAAGNEPRFKGYIPVLKQDGEVAVWPFSISVYNQLEELEDGLGESLAGYIIKFSRKGSGFMGTRYNVLGTGKTVDISEAEVPDFIPQLGPSELDEIHALLDENDVDYGAAPAKAAADETSDTDDEDEELDVAEGWEAL